MKKIRIGQIGIGHNHSDKIKAVKAFPELFELVGYAEENEEWVARRSQRPHFADVPRMSVEEVLEKSDAILVETDVWDLVQTAQRCVDAGKHVHIDKPANGTLEEFKHLLDTAKAKNLVVQLGYMYRYNPAVMRIFEMAKSGQLGDITAIHAEMSVPHADSYRTWLRNFKGGDLYIFGSHLIDIIVYLLGKPNKVMSSVVSSDKNGISSPDVTAALLEYDHAIARVFSSSVQWDGWAHRCLVVDGTLGTVHLQPMEDPLRHMTFTPKHEGKKFGVCMSQPITDLPFDPGNIRYNEMIRSFHDYIVGNAENPFPYEHEYAVQEVLWQAVGGVEMLGKELEKV